MMGMGFFLSVLAVAFGFFLGQIMIDWWKKG